jgi:hypothetical protein
MAKVLTGCAVFWGIAATSFAAVNNFSGSFACRFLIGLGGAPYPRLSPIHVLTTQRPDSPPSFRFTYRDSTHVKDSVLVLLSGSPWLPWGE